MELGETKVEEIYANRKALTLIVENDDIEFEKDGRVLKEEILDDNSQSIAYKFLKELQFEKEIDSIRHLRENIKELKTKFQSLLENPSFLEYEYMQELSMLILGLNYYFYRPTETHKHILLDLTNKVNFPYSTRAYLKLNDNQKKEKIIYWGTLVNNIFVLCGFNPIYEAVETTLNNVLFCRYIPIWKRLKLKLRK